MNKTMRKRKSISHSIPIDYMEDTMLYSIQQSFWAMYSYRTKPRASSHVPFWSRKKWKDINNPNGKQWVRWVARICGIKYISIYTFDDDQVITIDGERETDIRSMFVSRGNGIWDCMRISLKTKHQLKIPLFGESVIHHDNLWHTRQNVQLQRKI